MSDVTRILATIESGDPAAAERLFPLVYDELRRLARAKLAHEQPGQTLQATALVHEAYLRLVGGRGDREQETGDRKQRTGNREQETGDRAANPAPDSCLLSPVSFDSRGHFFAAAAEAMRRILVEAARRKQTEKRGGGWQRIVEVEPVAIEGTKQLDLLALDEALTQLAAEDKLAADLVKLRYFAGLTSGEAAEALGMSARTADRIWVYARTWLLNKLQPG